MADERGKPTGAKRRSSKVSREQAERDEAMAARQRARDRAAEDAPPRKSGSGRASD